MGSVNHDKKSNTEIQIEKKRSLQGLAPVSFLYTQLITHKVQKKMTLETFKMEPIIFREK